MKNIIDIEAACKVFNLLSEKKDLLKLDDMEIMSVTAALNCINWVLDHSGTEEFDRLVKKISETGI